MSATVIQMKEASLALHISRSLPRILRRKDEIISNICRATADYPPEWLEAQLEKNFHSIVTLILSGDTETHIIGKVEVRDELEILGLLS